MRALVILSTLVALATPVSAQPKRVTVAIYAPSVEFGSSSARVAYVQALAKAIEQNTGLVVEAQSYANLAALKKDNVDFAIIDGPCYATNLGWRLLATATIAGSTSRPYALFANESDLPRLRGKQLAFVGRGCNDADFVDNAMLESNADGFWGTRIGKPDLTGAIAEVASVKNAQAVFAPVGTAKGLIKVVDTASVPNPAFVVIGSKLPQATLDKVAAAVIGFGGGGAIAGWTKPARDLYTSFAARLRRVIKVPEFARGEPVRVDAKDALLEPPTINDHALVEVRHHYIRPPGERME